jgi:hypothetical protein
MKFKKLIRITQEEIKETLKKINKNKNKTCGEIG